MSKATPAPPIWTIDRFEESDDDASVAVLVSDDGSEIVMPRSALPDGVRQGDVLRMQLAPDTDETTRRRAEVEEMQRRLFGPPS